MEEDEIGKFLKSEEFIKGLPMVYLKDNKVVRHYPDGRIGVIKELDEKIQ